MSFFFILYYFLIFTKQRLDRAFEKIKNERVIVIIKKSRINKKIRRVFIKKERINKKSHYIFTKKKRVNAKFLKFFFYV